MTSQRIVLHPDHNRSVGEAFRGAPDLEVVTPGAAEVAHELATAAVLVTYRWDDSYLTDSLRWIQSISVGVDQYPIDRLTRAGVVLTSARGCHGPQVSEHAFGLLLALTRGIGRSMRNAESRLWKPIPGIEISGMKLGILGLGAIGEAIAEKAVAWGMEVVGTKSHVAGYSGAARVVYPAEETLAVFERSDVVISVLPDTESTRGIVTAECLAAMDGGWFVNVGRGTVVNEQDLLDALADGSLAGVGLDVFDPEPLPESSQLWMHPRVVITNHTAGLSPHYGSRLLEIFRRNLDALADVGEWVNRVG